MTLYQVSLNLDSMEERGSCEGLERETGFEPATACLEGISL